MTVPADHGAGTAITGLAFDGSGLLAVRPGRSASGTTDAVAYFSPNGSGWQYAGTIGAAAAWTPGLVKGSDYGFVVAGTGAAGQLVAFTAAGTGTTWAPTGSLGDAGTESVVGATVASAGAIVAVGYTAPGRGQQPVFLEANAAGRVRPVPLAGIPGGSIPELAVNGLAVAGGQQVAVGSAEGYPAVWRRSSGGAPGLWSPRWSQVSGSPGLAALTGVTHGSSGWLAVGAPGPVVMTSADGTSWRSATGPGSITADLAGVAAVATAAGPRGYVIRSDTFCASSVDGSTAGRLQSCRAASRAGFAGTPLATGYSNDVPFSSTSCPALPVTNLRNCCACCFFLLDFSTPPPDRLTNAPGSSILEVVQRRVAAALFGIRLIAEPVVVVDDAAVDLAGVDGLHRGDVVVVDDRIGLHAGQATGRWPARP